MPNETIRCGPNDQLCKDLLAAQDLRTPLADLGPEADLGKRLKELMESSVEPTVVIIDHHQE